jgi:hypothetical protein
VQKGGIADIKAHPWFKDFDWEAFAARKMKAPYVPQVPLDLIPSSTFVSCMPCIRVLCMAAKRRPSVPFRMPKRTKFILLASVMSSRVACWAWQGWPCHFLPHPSPCRTHPQVHRASCLVRLREKMINSWPFCEHGIQWNATPIPVPLQPTHQVSHAEDTRNFDSSTADVIPWASANEKGKRYKSTGIFKDF